MHDRPDDADHPRGPGRVEPAGRHRQTAYGRAFYGEIGVAARTSAEVVVPLVLGIVQPTSVIDVGCGTGAWLAAFARRGVDDVTGVDGDHVVVADLEIPPERFVTADLEDPDPPERRYDLAVSLEVAEHLPATAADRFVRHLTALAPVVLFSAAIPGQGGVHHVNEQWPGYWSARFRACGFEPLDVVRPLVWNDPEVACFYAQNTVLYAEAARVGELRDRARVLGGPADPLPLVHPRMLDAWREAAASKRSTPASLSSVLRQVPGAARRAVASRRASRASRASRSGRTGG